MRYPLAKICLFLLILASCHTHPRTGEHGPMGNSRQLILVVTPAWKSIAGFARRYERVNSNRTWSPIGPPIEIETGRNGLGWGLGRHQSKPFNQPQKREGDGRGTAGVFSISSAFGTLPAKGVAFINLPYHFRGAGLECVDDPKSTVYNQLLDNSFSGHRDWQSSEKMGHTTYDRVYRWGVVVDHNRPTTRAGAGSCIFMHIADGQGDGTAGCTTMRAADMLTTLGWLDAGKKPLLVQLPLEEYKSRAAVWKLPVFKIPAPETTQ